MLKMSRVLVIPANMNGNETIQALLMRVASSHATLLLTRKEDENEEAVRNIASIFGFEPSQFVEVYVQCRRQYERTEENVSLSSSLAPIVGVGGGGAA